MVHRVQLAEDERVGITGEAEPQRGRTTRTGEADRANVEHGRSQLLLDRSAYGVAATARDVEVCGLPAAVGDRHDLAGREVAEREERQSDTEGHPGDGIEGVIDAEVQPGADHGADEPAATNLATVRGRPGTTTM